MQLRHKTVYDRSELKVVRLPLSESLKDYHEDGQFCLLSDPLSMKRAAIIGMFVLRPAQLNWTGDGLSFYDVKDAWVYNYKGLDGGWLISSGNVVDGLRLALQYGVSDAVIIGSKSVSLEGCDYGSKFGYLWQPYSVCLWPHIYALDPGLEEKIAETRCMWQDMGYLSKRTYPATIIVSWSGRNFADQPRSFSGRDFLEARVFREKHPNGDAIEVYIITSHNGAARIRSRAHRYGLADRIDTILIEMSPNDDHPDDLDLKNLPAILFDRLGMRIVNHDGGRDVLRRFCAHGALTQLHVSLCRGSSLRDVVVAYDDAAVQNQNDEHKNCDDHNDGMVMRKAQARHSDGFRSKIRSFFAAAPPIGIGDANTRRTTKIDGTVSAVDEGIMEVDEMLTEAVEGGEEMGRMGIPRSLPLSSVIEDFQGSISIAVFNMCDVKEF